MSTADPDLARLVDRMSVSRLNSWAARCQFKWFCTYVLRRPFQRNRWAAMGNAFDRTANAVYFRKLQTHETPTDAADVYAAEWDAELEELELPDAGALLDKMVANVRNWRDRIATTVQPIREPQFKFVVDVASPDPGKDEEAGLDPMFTLTGWIDLVAEVEVNGKRLPANVDQKANGRSWTAADVIRETQPAAYRIGSGQSLFQFHQVRTDTVKPKATRITRPVTQADSDLVVKRAAIARRQIAHAFKTGDFLPNRSDRMCSKRWCDHWQYCQKVHGGPIPD